MLVQLGNVHNNLNFKGWNVLEGHNFFLNIINKQKTNKKFGKISGSVLSDLHRIGCHSVSPAILTIPQEMSG